MSYFKVLFVMISIIRMDSIQNEVTSGTDDKVTTACFLKNFTVVPKVYHGNTRYINLHLSWEKLDDRGTIHIVSNNQSEKDCWEEHSIFNYPLFNNSLVKPDMVTNPEVEPGCEYQIIVSSETQQNTSCYYDYTVPESVEDMYDCTKFRPQETVLSVEHVKDNQFLVKWDPGEKTVNNRSSITKKVDFEYFLSSKQTDSAETAKEIKTNLKERTSLISMKLHNGENYTLEGIFRNNFSCSVKNYKYFIAPTSTSHYNIAIIIVGIAAIFCLVIVLNYRKIARYKTKLLDFTFSRRREETERPKPIRLQDINVPMNVNIQYTPVEILDGIVDEYEFPKNKIIITDVIGSGAFGQVYSAKVIGNGGIQDHKMVAVKTLGEGENITREAANDFIAEIEIFKKIGHHPNIVTLLGCCTIEPPYMMIMEFIPCGDLKNYLLELRQQWLKNKNLKVGKQVFFPDTSDGAYIDPPGTPSVVSITSSRLPSSSETVCTTLDDPETPVATYSLEKILDHTELQNFALQIARGMAHLEKIQVTHRDLAARNILINEFKTLKISDFGLSRSGPYINHKTKKLPLRWMAIEAIVDQKYDNRSDVWSFGVVLWEIGTLGAFPYESVPDSFIQQFLQMGRRLERPEVCTDELYSLMKQCWATEPERRPTFQELVDALDVKKRKVYVDFDQLNPTYVFPPSDIKRLTENLVQVVDIGT